MEEYHQERRMSWEEYVKSVEEKYGRKKAKSIRSAYRRDHRVHAVRARGYGKNVPDRLVQGQQTAWDILFP